MQEQLVKIPAKLGCKGCWYDNKEECPFPECETDKYYSLIFVEKEDNTDESEETGLL